MVDPFQEPSTTATLQPELQIATTQTASRHLNESLITHAEMRSSVYVQGAAAFFSLFTLGSAAADCYAHDDASIPSFSVSDGRKLQNEIAGNKFEPQLDFPFLIEASHTASFSMGSARACLANTYSWQNTHIDQNDLRFAVQSILDECDRDDGTSKGGKIQVTGDTGLVLDIIVKDVALEC